MKLKTLPQEEEACSVGLSRPQANCAPSLSDERQLSFPAPTPSFLLYISRAESRTSEKQHEEKMRAGQEAQRPELTHTRETQGALSFFYYGVCRRPHGSRGGLASFFGEIE